MEEKKGSAPRVTLADIEGAIANEFYFTAADGVDGSFGLPKGVGADFPEREALRLLTICVLVLRNGFTVTGESYCASPESFDAQTGRDGAREKAVEKIWPLLVFELKQRLLATV